jgi:L-rhamnose mutarotase
MADVRGPTNPEVPADGVQRFGSVIELDPGMEARYRELHADVWTGVLARLRESHVRNYSIYIAELAGRKYLFSYFEYTGSDFEADMRAIAADPETRRWWRETDPCQIRLPDAPPGSQWTPLERVFLQI